MAGKKKISTDNDSPKSKKTDPPEDTPIDPFAALFEGFDENSQYVNLTRVKPAEFQDVPIAGYLERLVPGADEQYLKERFGGGRYMIQKKDSSSHRIITTRYIDISGFPKLPMAPALSPVGRSDDVASGIESVQVDIGGVSVPFSGDMAKMKEMILFVKMLKDAFPEPPSINDALLKMAIEKQSQPDPLEQLIKLKELGSLLTSDGAPSGTGPWDILSSAITQAGGVIQKMMVPGGAAPGRLPGAPMGKTPVPKAVDGPPKPETLDQPGAESPEEIGEPMSISQQEAVMAVVSVFVKCWRLSPPTEVSKVVDMVDMILRQENAAVRAALSDQFAERIKSLGEIELVDFWDDPESSIGSREAFAEFCTQVFELYVDADRKVVLV